MNITITHSGIEIAEVIDGYRFWRIYVGFTVKEAVRRFNLDKKGK